MKTSFSISLWTLIPTLSFIGLVAATPVAEVAARNAETPVKYIDGSTLPVKEARDTTLERRGGSHTALFQSSYDCSGSSYSVSEFGCGGYCYQNLNANSILLTQATTGNPKPTAELYTSNDCTGSHSHAGIWDGYTSGCTNTNIGTWNSAYLYFAC